MLYSMLATSGNAEAGGLLAGLITCYVIALLIAFFVGFKRGIRKVSWLGVTWLTSGLAFCILQSTIGDAFANALPIKVKGLAFLPSLILACMCMLVCLTIHGIVAMFLRKPKRPRTVDKNADIFVRDDDWIEYDDESEDYDDYDDYKGHKLVQHMAYSKHGNFGFYTPPMQGETAELYPSTASRIFGGLSCMLTCALILASVVLFSLFILQGTPLKDTALFSAPAILKLVSFTKDYALDFVMIGIIVAFLLRASKKVFMDALRSLIVVLGGIALVCLCFYAPFSKWSMHPDNGGTWLVNTIVGMCVNGSRSMAGKFAPVVGRIFAGVGMSVIVIVLMVVINILFKKAIKSLYEFATVRVVDTVFAVLLYFVVALGLCILFWSVFVIFTEFGLLETMFFTEKSTLAKGFFDACQFYVQPMIESVKTAMAEFFAFFN